MACRRPYPHSGSTSDLLQFMGDPEDDEEEEEEKKKSEDDEEENDGEEQEVPWQV